MASEYFDEDEEGRENREADEDKRRRDDPLQVLLSTEFGPSGSQVPELYNDSSESDCDWEDLNSVATDRLTCSTKVSVSIDAKQLSNQQQAQEKVRKEIELMWRRLRKMQSLQLKKTYALCFLGHGIFLSNRCDDVELRGLFLSIVPFEIIKHSMEQEVSCRSLIDSILAWSRRRFPHVRHASTIFPDLKLSSRVSKFSHLLGLVAVFRCLGLKARIVIHFHPAAIAGLGTERNIRIKENKKERKRKSSSADSKKAIKRCNLNKKSTYFGDEDSSEHAKASEDCEISYFGSTDDRESNSLYTWLEVLDNEERSWLCIHPYLLEIILPTQLESIISLAPAAKISSIAFVVSFDEGGRVMDVTPRYVSSTLHTETRKGRTDIEQENWWRLTLAPLKPKGKAYEVESTQLLNCASAANNPVPMTIGGLKSHPLYVLARDIHKYEGIYPADTQPIAQVRGEPVFSRANVFTLHTREKWLLEGRQVLENQQPFKTVSGHQKPLKSNEREKKPAKKVGLFGEWQTKIYEPPLIVDGRLPRNKYGNIEIFKPWMLPIGCCHLTKKGIQSTAKRLGIDFVPAMIGWDFHAGTNHPVIEGIIVLEDVRELLECAWWQEKNIARDKDLKEKSEKAVANWKHLVKAVLLRERLKDRYLSDD